MTLRAKLAAATGVLALLSANSPVHAQIATMGPPLPTTLIVTRAVSSTELEDKLVGSFGVGRERFKFLLTDAYVDDPMQRAYFADVWEYVRAYQPNFVVQGGINPGCIARIRPGQTTTIRAMFAPLGRTLEVISCELGIPTFRQAEPRSF